MIRNFIIPVICLSIFIACTTAPITGRSQLILISEIQEIKLGITAYNQVLQESKLSKNKTYVDSVKRVGDRIASYTGKNYNWQFNVIESDQINAWCLPGGKIAFYEGILDIMDNLLKKIMSFDPGENDTHIDAQGRDFNAGQSRILKDAQKYLFA